MIDFFSLQFLLWSEGSGGMLSVRPGSGKLIAEIPTCSAELVVKKASEDQLRGERREKRNVGPPICPCAFFFFILSADWRYRPQLVCGKLRARAITKPVVQQVESNCWSEGFCPSPPYST
uniref:Uncharacterized protein n=1 Tax=Micrurus spixii TaxID=129469 RepID=A0A2D4LIH3_9SAUR